MWICVVNTYVSMNERKTKYVYKEKLQQLPTKNTNNNTQSKILPWKNYIPMYGIFYVKHHNKSKRQILRGILFDEKYPKRWNIFLSMDYFCLYKIGQINDVEEMLFAMYVMVKTNTEFWSNFKCCGVFCIHSFVLSFELCTSMCTFLITTYLNIPMKNISFSFY